MTFFSRKQPLAEKKKKVQGMFSLQKIGVLAKEHSRIPTHPQTQTDTDTGKYSLSHQFGKDLKRRPQGRELQ